MATAAADAPTSSPRDDELGLPWELFIAAVTVISLVNLVLFVLPLSATHSVVVVVDGILAVVFLADVIVRFRRSRPRRAYLLRRGGWIDLLGSLPAPGLRLLRIVRLRKTIRLLERKGHEEVLFELKLRRAVVALLLILLVVLVMVELNAIVVLAIEQHHSGSNIHTGGDALWWALVTVATVGYGDRYPVTSAGRFVAAGLIVVGVALFGTLSGYLATTLAAVRPRRLRANQPGVLDELDNVVRVLDEQERTTAELRARVLALEAALREAARRARQSGPPESAPGNAPPT